MSIKGTIICKIQKYNLDAMLSSLRPPWGSVQGSLGCLERGWPLSSSPGPDLTFPWSLFGESEL